MYDNLVLITTTTIIKLIIQHWSYKSIESNL